MRAAELQNSSLSSGEFMMRQWQRLVDTNINTVLGSVTWEMIEPEEGVFNFDELDKVVLGARQFGLRLVLLWFGSFKNGRNFRASALFFLKLADTEPSLRNLNLCPTLDEA